MMGERITPEHLARKAVVYVRQSTPDQVRHNRESQRRQYELAERARTMGWQEVEVIDEDLGCSGATSAGRSGFARLVASVCLREVGAVFSLEASRLARNNRDWYQLLDMCALVGTLIVDFDGVYDPRILNDRLLLGLKGTMSEFELGLIRQRAHEALRQMARRGELITNLPVGYRKADDGRCEKDPDLRVQHAVELVFEKFSQLGSVRQVLLWFRQDRVKLPAIEHGPHGLRVVWKLPVYNTIIKILQNPVYAGAYAYGRTCTRTELEGAALVKKRGYRRQQEEWEVLIPNHHEGYISWDTYERNQRQIQENANMKGAMIRGPALAGKSLLAGLLRCARCGRKLHVSYSGADSNVPRYGCNGASVTHGAGRCISFGGLTVDRAVEREVLKVVEPAAVEAALGALAELEASRDERRAALKLALQQARYEADRARRQYDAVEPENRLVASELERRWNAALAGVRQLEEELDRLLPSGTSLSEKERQELLCLSEDLQSVWSSPLTDMRTKKRLVRTVVEEIIADVDEERGVVELVIRWTGGCHTRLLVRKNRTGEHRFRTDRKAVEVVRELAKVARDREIAAILNRLGMKTGKGNTWTEARVRSLRSEHRIPVVTDGGGGESPNWVTMKDAASLLGVSPMSVRRLILKGVLPARQAVPCAPWMIEKRLLESEAVKQAVAGIKQGGKRPLPTHPDQQKLDLKPT